MDPKDLKPLFDYLDKKFAGQDRRFDHIDENLELLRTAVDNLAKMVKDFRDEHIVLHRRLETLEKWAKQVSAKVGIPLPSES